MICSILPSIRLREAAVVNLGSTAVANTLPAGGALAMGISWTMLSGWGVSAADYVLYTLVSGIWNVFARLGLPIIALLLIMTVSRPQAGLLAGAVAGLVLLVIVAAGFGLLLRSETFARPRGCSAPAPHSRSPAGSRAGSRRRRAGPCRDSGSGRPGSLPRAAGGSPLPRPSSSSPVAGPAGERARGGPVPGRGALADLAGGVRIRPSAHRAASHTGRRRALPSSGSSASWPRAPTTQSPGRSQRPSCCTGLSHTWRPFPPGRWPALPGATCPPSGGAAAAGHGGRSGPDSRTPPRASRRRSRWRPA